MLGCRPPPAYVARALHKASFGQPVYLEQLLAGLVRTADIESEDNRISWGDQDVDFEAPPAAVADARAMIAPMPVCHRRVLEAVALSEGASVQVLAPLLGWEIDSTGSALRALIKPGAVRWEGGATSPVLLGHPALSSILLKATSPWRRHAIQARMADAVSTAEASPVAVRALSRAGRVLDAARIAGKVARDLYEKQQVRTALEVLEPVVRGLAGKPVPNGAQMAEVFLLHSLCLQATNPAHSDTARTLRVADRLVSRPPAMVARVAWAKATLARCIGHYRSYARGVDDALALLGPDDPEEIRAWLLIERGDAQRLHGSIRLAHESYVEAEQIARRIQVMKQLARATVGIAACQMFKGEISEAERQASRAMAQLERIGDYQGFWFALAVWGEAVRRQARFSEALGVLYQRAPEARNHEDPRAYSALMLTIAWCEVDLERLGQAQEWVDELHVISHKGEHLHTRIETGLLHGRILLDSGQRRQAAYVLQDVERKARAAELRVQAEQARAMHGEALWQLGDRDGARACYQSAVLGLMGLGAQPALADAIISRTRGPGRETDADELFAPARRWLDDHGPPLIRLEELLARGAYARRRGDRDQARRLHRQAAMVLNRVATKLNPTDRAALRVHSWSRRIRRGLR
jgi:tetratricopeptide (TPR) repeat protein